MGRLFIRTDLAPLEFPPDCLKGDELAAWCELEVASAGSLRACDRFMLEAAARTLVRVRQDPTSAEWRRELEADLDALLILRDRVRY